MAEPKPGPAPFALVAEFADPGRLVEAARRMRAAGYARLDAATPFPVDGLAEVIGFRDRRIPRLTLAGGVLGAAAGFGMQVWANLAYPIDIGGRPLVAPPAFMLITFELMVLFAVLAAIGGMLVLNRLPRLNHPLFDVPGFERATSNRFFLVVFGDDPRFDAEATGRALARLGPERVTLAGHSEEPE